MTHFRGKYRIETTRLPWWDYSQAGWYYVTICTRDRQCVFGEIVDQRMIMSQFGEMVTEEWLRTEKVRPDVRMDEWILMPNHLHGIIVIQPSTDHPTAVKETSQRDVSTTRSPFQLKANSLGAIIGQFKSVCTKRIRATGFYEFTWQSRFYERIIRDERSLETIRQYIIDNPARWDLDNDNPKNYLTSS